MSHEATTPDLQIFHGTIIHATDTCAADILSDAVLTVQRGRVVQLSTSGGGEHELATTLRQHDVSSEQVVRLQPHQFLMPGLVDTHIHPCQYANAGLALDLPLLKWLRRYTFPMESRFSDEAFANSVYTAVVGRTLRSGTTCASYFGSIHRPACERLAELCAERGQRALVGKVNMDQNAPADYCETTDESLSETRAFVNTLLTRYGSSGGDSSLVRPTITPRFAISCTERLLAGLGEIAAKHQLHVQSHINETLHEVYSVSQLFPAAAHYTDVYRRAGLLGPRTVMAHCVHVRDDELHVLRTSGTGIAHCAASNNNLRSGLCDVRRLQRAGLDVGIGTDVSGGHHPSVLDAVRCALLTSNIHTIVDENYPHLTVRECFRMATLEGANALGVGDQIGNFALGKQFDALLASVGDSDSEIDLLMPLTPDELLQKFIYLGDSRDVGKVYVAGREVVSSGVLQ